MSRATGSVLRPWVDSVFEGRVTLSGREVNVRTEEPAGLARNTTFLLLARIVGLAVKAGYFVVLARVLGASGYGTFVAVVAFVGILSPFARWGAGGVLLQRVSSGEVGFREAWSRALGTIFLMGAISIGVVMFLDQWIFPGDVRPLLVIGVCVAEFWFTALWALGAQAYQAFERLDRMGLAELWLSVCRLSAAMGMLLFVDAPSAVAWAGLYLVATAFAATTVFAGVCREIGVPIMGRALLPGDLQAGFYFAVSDSATNVTNNVDKTMLARMKTVGVSGIYAAAYRAVEFSFLPVLALLHSSYPSFFRHGARGIGASMALSRKLSLPAFVYCALAGMVLYAAAPIMPWLIGDEFKQAVDVLRMLSPLPLIRAMSFLAANALTGAGYQSTRSAAQVVAALTNVGLNLALIPPFGIVGAVVATLATEFALAVAFWLIAGRLRRSQIRNAAG